MVYTCRRLCGKNAYSVPRATGLRGSPRCREGGHPGAGGAPLGVRAVKDTTAWRSRGLRLGDLPVPMGNSFSRSLHTWGFVMHLRSDRTGTVHRAGGSGPERGRLGAARASPPASRAGHLSSCRNWVSPPCALTLRVGPDQLAKKVETGACNRMRGVGKSAPFRSGEAVGRVLKGSGPPGLWCTA